MFVCLAGDTTTPLVTKYYHNKKCIFFYFSNAERLFAEPEVQHTNADNTCDNPKAAQQAVIIEILVHRVSREAATYQNFIQAAQPSKTGRW